MTQQDDTFTHEPLDISKATIRVLQLTTFSKKNGIRCTMKHIDLENNAHVCLSYTWGEDTPSHTIYINDRPFQIRDSLLMFLQRAQKQKIQDWLWIDAICIDQQNDGERNHQVRLMGDVYRKAKHVLIHVGEIPFNVEFAAAMVRKFDMRNKVYEPWGSTLNDHRFGLMTRTLFCFAGKFPESRYWSRMWIVQEVVLAKAAFIVLNGTLLDVRYFDFIRPSTGNHWKAPAWSLLRERRQLEKYGLKSDLIDLMDMTSSSKCQMPNDRIYSLLGLLPSNISDQIIIDHNRDWLLLVLDVLQILQSTRYNEAWSDIELQGFLANLKTTMTILCRECALSTGHTLRLEDGRVFTPISDLMDEVQDVYLIAGRISSHCRLEGTRHKAGFRKGKRFFSCSCCWDMLLEDCCSIFSRPIDNVLCGRELNWDPIIHWRLRRGHRGLPCSHQKVDKLLDHSVLRLARS